MFKVQIKPKEGGPLHTATIGGGRTMIVRPTVLEDFKTLVKDQQLSEDNIIIKEDKGICVPGKPVTEPESQQNPQVETILINAFAILDVCALTPDPGPCECYSERYFYNFRKRRCEIFIYGCCGGNQNNFETEQECLQRCRVCAQAPDSGPCFGYFERYFYNFRKGRCEIFIYGGCSGNQNNFETEQELMFKGSDNF
uniref:BPTI/Kunitz inhibitor domain-containing protein n=1 Tax=Oryzias latipes TaxID=8090 RepID=A0A3P9GZB7_ORYLA